MGGLKTAMDRSPVIRSLWIKVTDQHVRRVWIKAYHPWAWGIGNWGCEKPSFWELGTSKSSPKMDAGEIGTGE